MNIISKIVKAEAKQADWVEPRGIVNAVQVIPVPGFFINLQLGEAGLIIKAGDNKVGIPLDTLIEAAQAIDPNLKPPTKPAAKNKPNALG